MVDCGQIEGEEFFLYCSFLLTVDLVEICVGEGLGEEDHIVDILVEYGVAVGEGVGAENPLSHELGFLDCPLWNHIEDNLIIISVIMQHDSL